MHPECALVFQHLKAKEECTQILRLEQSNRSNATGQSTTCRRESWHAQRVQTGTIWHGGDGGAAEVHQGAAAVTGHSHNTLGLPGSRSGGKEHMQDIKIEGGRWRDGTINIKEGGRGLCWLRHCQQVTGHRL